MYLDYEKFSVIAGSVLKIVFCQNVQSDDHGNHNKVANRPQKNI